MDELALTKSPSMFLLLMTKFEKDCWYMGYRLEDFTFQHEWLQKDGRQLYIATEAASPTGERGLLNTLLCFKPWVKLHGSHQPSDDDFFRFGTMWSGIPYILSIEDLLGT